MEQVYQLWISSYIMNIQQPVLGTLIGTATLSLIWPILVLYLGIVIRTFKELPDFRILVSLEISRTSHIYAPETS